MADLTKISEIELTDRREHPEWFIPMNATTEVERDQVRREACEETLRRAIVKMKPENDRLERESRPTAEIMGMLLD
jgi:hypothetical protein